MTTPRDEPQRQALRCETCEHFQTRFEYGNKKMCMKIRKVFSNSYQIGLPLYTEIVGCASHSANAGAQARIVAVVKELEARLYRSKSQQMNFTSDEGARADGYESGLDSAIALLKEGVGK